MRSKDKFNAALRAAIRENPLIAPEFASMNVNFTSQTEWVKVDATNK